VTVVRRVEMFRGDAALGTWVYSHHANAAYEKLRASRPADSTKYRGTISRRPLTTRSVTSSPSTTGRKGPRPAVQTELRTVLNSRDRRVAGCRSHVFVLHDVDGIVESGHRGDTRLDRARRQVPGAPRAVCFCAVGSATTWVTSQPGRRLLSGQPEPPQLRIEPHPVIPSAAAAAVLLPLAFARASAIACRSSS